MQRRLPVYLMIDCSESMVGPAIEAVTQGVNSMIGVLRNDPQALETAFLSLITFNRYAKQVVPLTEVLAFAPPSKFSVRPGTALGAALTLLMQCMQREVVKTTPTTKGDYRPLVFLLTDGQPTDSWEQAADALCAMHHPSIANVYAIGCGQDVDATVLKRISDIVLMMPDLSTDKWRKFFVWLTASIQTASQSVERSGDGPLGLSALPEGVLEGASTSVGYRDPTPRQVFLHGVCGRQRKPYIMRFARRQDGRYDAVAAHVIDEFSGDDAELLPPINSSLLNGCPSCPYCENDAVAVCPCGAIFCVPAKPTESATCPKCQSQLAFSDNAAFDIRRAEG